MKKNKNIAIFLFIIVIVVIIIIVADFSSSRPGKRGSNPYEYSIKEYSHVDENLIKYRETKQIKLTCEHAKGIACFGGKIFLIADNYLHVLNKSGQEDLKKDFKDTANTVFANNNLIIIGFKNYFITIDKSGKIISNSEFAGENSFFTSVNADEKYIYVADAGMRKILIYDHKGLKTGEFEGESGSSLMHGFIVPSPYFDLAINNTNELWVVNPGAHSIQNYRNDGSLVNFWEKSSLEIDGFSGCCNPAHFAFLPGGEFVTSEKGLVRIKVYDKSGNFKSVVAAPDRFKEGGKAPDIAVDENGEIIALDYDKKMIRIFKEK